MGKAKKQKEKAKLPPSDEFASDGDKDFDGECFCCGQTPTVHPTGLCGPCCFGDASTAGGNW